MCQYFTTMLTGWEFTCNSGWHFCNLQMFPEGFNCTESVVAQFKTDTQSKYEIFIVNTSNSALHFSRSPSILGSMQVWGKLRKLKAAYTHKNTGLLHWLTHQRSSVAILLSWVPFFQKRMRITLAPTSKPFSHSHIFLVVESEFTAGCTANRFFLSLPSSPSLALRHKPNAEAFSTLW